MNEIDFIFMLGMTCGVILSIIVFNLMYCHFED